VTLIGIGVDVMRYVPNGHFTWPRDTARRALLAEATYVAAGVLIILGFFGYVVFGLLA
jgi:hypothetical protein